MKKLLFQIFIVIAVILLIVTVSNLYKFAMPVSKSDIDQESGSETIEKIKQESSVRYEDIQYPESVIPGLSPQDVYLSLQQQGFSTKKTNNSDEYGWMWENTFTYGNFKYMVYTFTTKVGYVESVKVSVLVDPPSTVEGCTSFYEMIASLPYRGSNLYLARNFIKENILKKKATKVIGGAKWTITTPTKWATIIYIESAKKG